jgi:outer membrane protein assembly factor BamB
MVANYFGYETEKPPVVADSYLYASSATSIYCLDSLSGTKIWSYITDRPLFSSPIVVDGEVYIGSSDPGWFVGTHVEHNLYAFDGLTGDKIWNYTFTGSIDSSPVVIGNIVYVGVSDVITESPDFQGNGHVYALELTSIPSPSTTISLSDLQLIAIIVVVIVVILAVLVLIYKIRRKQ